MTLARASLIEWRKLVLLVMVMLATIGAWEVGKTILRTRDANAAVVFDHFTCYKISPPIEAAKVTVTVFDQFNPAGRQVVVHKSDTLCTPAAKLVQ